MMLYLILKRIINVILVLRIILSSVKLKCFRLIYADVLDWLDFSWLVIFFFFNFESLCTWFLMMVTHLEITGWSAFCWKLEKYWEFEISRSQGKDLIWVTESFINYEGRFLSKNQGELSNIMVKKILHQNGTNNLNKESWQFIQNTIFRLWFSGRLSDIFKN